MALEIASLFTSSTRFGALGGDLNANTICQELTRFWRITRIGGDYQWSRTGKFIAFTAPIEMGLKLDPRKGLPETPDLLLAQGRPRGVLE